MLPGRELPRRQLDEIRQPTQGGLGAAGRVRRHQSQRPPPGVERGLTSGATAHASWVTNAALLVLRELCGGHGFHSYNEIVTARVDRGINTTFGGDNTVLCYESVRVAARDADTVSPIRITSGAR